MKKTLGNVRETITESVPTGRNDHLIESINSDNDGQSTLEMDLHTILANQMKG